MPASEPHQGVNANGLSGEIKTEEVVSRGSEAGKRFYNASGPMVCDAGRSEDTLSGAFHTHWVQGTF